MMQWSGPGKMYNRTIHPVRRLKGFLVSHLAPIGYEEREELLRAMVHEYRTSWLDTQRELTKCSEVTSEAFLQAMERPRCEEWGLLYTLCQVLEANGTEFEAGSVLSNWWSENKEV